MNHQGGDVFLFPFVHLYLAFPILRMLLDTSSDDEISMLLCFV